MFWFKMTERWKEGAENPPRLLPTNRVHDLHSAPTGTRIIVSRYLRGTLGTGFAGTAATGQEREHMAID